MIRAEYSINITRTLISLDTGENNIDEEDTCES